jgi:hypothetical protein
MAGIARETIQQHGSVDLLARTQSGSAIPANPWADAPVQAANRVKRSHIFGRVLGVALAALLVLPSATATQPAEAGKKFKTITKTFSSNGQIDIPDGGGTQGPANPYPTTIDVDAFGKFKRAKIKDVNLTLRGVDHQQSTNVDVMLALGNKRSLLMADAGDATDVSGLTITLDDQAEQDLPTGDALASGTFRPGNFAGSDNFPAPAPLPNGNEDLAAFNGLKPDGEWALFVFDDAGASTGSIDNGWELEITAKVKEDKKDKKGKKGKGKKAKNEEE